MDRHSTHNQPVFPPLPSRCVVPPQVRTQGSLAWILDVGLTFTGVAAGGEDQCQNSLTPCALPTVNPIPWSPAATTTVTPLQRSVLERQRNGVDQALLTSIAQGVRSRHHTHRRYTTARTGVVPRPGSRRDPVYDPPYEIVPGGLPWILPESKINSGNRPRWWPVRDRGGDTDVLGCLEIRGFIVRTRRRRNDNDIRNRTRNRAEILPQIARRAGVRVKPPLNFNASPIGIGAPGDNRYRLIRGSGGRKMIKVDDLRHREL